MTQLPAKNAVILMNLGTPEALTLGAVRKFLREFLGDARVVEIPRLIWWPILYGIILPFRPKKALAAYQSVWTAQGSPLKVITLQQVAALQQHFDQQTNVAGVKVVHAMTYGHPSLSEQVTELRKAGAERIIVLPLYPQYSATTTAPIYDQFAKIIKSSRDIPEVLITRAYFDHPLYVKALSDSIREHWAKQVKAQKLLFSFHGIPQRCVDKGDPYYSHAMATAKAVAEALQLSDGDWQVSFQSRLGKAQWLQPYTDKILVQWAEQGIESVDVICPAFSADCIETLEEIQEENCELFLHSGGKSFAYIPCLNSRPDHIELMADLSGTLFKRY